MYVCSGSYTLFFLLFLVLFFLFRKGNGCATREHHRAIWPVYCACGSGWLCRHHKQGPGCARWMQEYTEHTGTLMSTTYGKLSANNAFWNVRRDMGDYRVRMTCGIVIANEYTWSGEVWDWAAMPSWFDVWGKRNLYVIKSCQWRREKITLRILVAFLPFRTRGFGTDCVRVRGLCCWTWVAVVWAI